MSRHPLELSRDRILDFRRRVAGFDERLPSGPGSLRHAAWAGLQDSMPRAALLSVHARVADTVPTTLDDPSLIQLWGPRFSAFVVAAVDRPVFTLGRLPDDVRRRTQAVTLADRLEAFLDGRAMPYGVVGRALGVDPNQLRYAAPTGRVLIRWDGARQPVIWTVPPPAMDPFEARVELARRFLHIFGPTTSAAFETWAGIRSPRGQAAFEALAGSLSPVRTPVGDAWILDSDEPSFRAALGPPAPARLLPSGDAYFLLQGAERELLVPDAELRSRLWTPRVWPGAVLVAGQIVGTWRRASADITIEPWRPLTHGERDAVAAEGASMPLPGLEGGIRIRWRD